MPQLVKLQEELKDSGFVIIATHVQNATQEEVVNLCRSKKVNYSITSQGNVPGDTGNGIPRAFLFDSKGALVQAGYPESMKPKIHELVKSEPHWLAAGREYTKLKPVAESLKTTKNYGQVLKKLEKDVKGEGAVAEEAKYLQERILGYGKRTLESVKALEAEDALSAQQAYTEISTLWKGCEVGTESAARLKELKADKEFQTELKASTLAHQILAECDKLIAQQGKINLDYAPNKKIAATVRSMVPVLKKKYPEAKATSKLAEQLKGYGFKES
jgi:hypothetical protein